MMQTNKYDIAELNFQKLQFFCPINFILISEVFNIIRIISY